jgi:hypothetical protein
MDFAHSARLCFSPTYRAARARFRDAGAALGLAVESRVLPGHRGPAGEELAADWAWVGPADARHVAVVLSATHGVEGFCGSGGQIDWLLSGAPAALPPRAAVLLVHAVNPFGFAWESRGTEDNVDLNRNWVDFARPTPENPGYDELAAHLVPDLLDERARADADAALAAWRRTRDETAWREAMSCGQYRHPFGLFYGGTGPTWSRLLEEDLIARFALARRDAVAVIDLHTGLGPHGYGEPICHHPDGGASLARAFRLWGDSVTEPAKGNSVSVRRTGLTVDGWARLVGDRLAFMSLEFGTRPHEQVFAALRGDAWCRRRGLDADDPAQRAARAAMRDAFAPDADSWREMICFRTRQTIRQAVEGLSGG